jgi:hypothetical protein
MPGAAAIGATPPACKIASRQKHYALERSIGIPPEQACRHAGGKVENGEATEWEQNKRIQAWIAYYRSLGSDDDAKEGGGFDLARLINSRLPPAFPSKEEGAAFYAMWEIPRWPVFYSSWTFRSTARFLTVETLNA